MSRAGRQSSKADSPDLQSFITVELVSFPQVTPKAASGDGVVRKGCQFFEEFQLA